VRTVIMVAVLCILDIRYFRSNYSGAFVSFAIEEHLCALTHGHTWLV